ncbi:hypothetical protein F5Y10DRAFT_43613 [Nemania abortiva]|nr:hypothetical protein F5Y10DRAFT_43613 [Nemania abortiva]
MAPTQASQAALFTTLPAPGVSPPQLPSGTVSLYKDASWSSPKVDVRTSEYVTNVRHQSPMVDTCTWIAFNLPPGTVMTLTDHIVSAGQNVADLRDTGASIDLIGVGHTVAVDLIAYKMNDAIASFFWRIVDLTRGAIEMFDDLDYTHIRQVIFLADFEPGVIHDISRWYMNDKMTSVRWRSMVDRQTAALFEHPDGAGASYRNISGTISTKEVSDLRTVGFDDKISSFRWDAIVPMKEIIAPFNVTAASSRSSSSLVSTISGTNQSSLPQPVTVKLRNSTSQTVTVSTEDQFVTSVSTTLSILTSEKAGVPGVGEIEATQTWAVTVGYQYTNTTTRSTSTTQTVDLDIEQQVSAPPFTNYEAKLLVNIGQLPPTTYKTTATRWYNVPVSGAQPDPSNNNWYKRTEEIQISMTGALAASTRADIQATPL